MGKPHKERRALRAQEEQANPENPMYEQCFKANFPDRSFEVHAEALRRPLPVNVRVLHSHPAAGYCRSHLASALETPTAVEWYEPKGFAFSLNAGQQALRKTAEHEFVKRWSRMGGCVRQEAASFLPGIAVARALEGHPASAPARVLDMCGAPGMKTMHIVDVLQSRAASASAAGESSLLLPAGSEDCLQRQLLLARAALRTLVVSNEVDAQRCCMLAHLVQRLRSASVLVVNHDGTNFPMTRDSFDVVVCDVPCGGDGTIRKQPQLWASFSPNRSVGLHRLQLSILREGLRLSRRHVVYSTCSTQPVENEAVVACAAGFAFEDARTTSTRMRRRRQLADEDESVEPAALCTVESLEGLGLPSEPGICTWKVFARAADTSAPGAEAKLSVKEFAPADVGKMQPGDPGVRRSMFVQQPEAVSGTLRRTQRLWQEGGGDTGGFFCALVAKTHEANVVRETRYEPAAEAQSRGALEETVAPAVKVSEQHSKLVEAFEPLAAVQPAAVKELEKLFGFVAAADGSEFPFENLFVRTSSRKNVYLVSDPMREVLIGECEKRRHNAMLEMAAELDKEAETDQGVDDGAAAASSRPDGWQQPLLIMHAGVRVFQLDESRHYSYRVTQQAVEYVAPFLPHRIVTASVADAEAILADSRGVVVVKAKAAGDDATDEGVPKLASPDLVAQMEGKEGTCFLHVRKTRCLFSVIVGKGKIIAFIKKEERLVWKEVVAELAMHEDGGV